MLIESDGNCGVENSVAKFLNDNKWIVSAALIALGVMLLFFGGSKWDSILTIVGFFFGAGGILFVIFAFANIKSTT